jgi:ABC-type methionine transport system ATPase subunit
MIEIDQLYKSFGGTEVLSDISLRVDDGEILAVVGPSGAGKTTLSRCVSLLEHPTSGSVVVNGANLASLSGEKLRDARQRIGTIFQSAPLLRRRTVAQNVALPLEYFRATKRSIDARVESLLHEVGLTERADFYPAQLSGGQRQRVGIARALALKPTVLLSDEATSGLDPATTRSILALLARLKTELNLSIILITHEMEVVREVADRVARIDHGRIVESGSVSEIVLQPASQLARDLLPQRPLVGHGRLRGAWEITYASRDVPGNWFTELLREAPADDIEILSASVEAIHEVAVGRIVIGSNVLEESWLRARVEPRGLHVRSIDLAAAAAEIGK